MPKDCRDHEDAWLLAVGTAIHERRLSLGISQQDLADLAGVHRTYVSDIERGARNLTLSTVIKLASALKVQASRLFRRAEEYLEQGKLEQSDLHNGGVYPVIPS